MSNNVLVIAEQRDGVLKKVAFEMLGAGAELATALGGSVEAALRGYDGALLVVSHDDAFAERIGLERSVAPG